MSLIIGSMQRIVEEAQRQQQNGDTAEASSREQNTEQSDYSALNDRIGFIGAGQVHKC